MYEILIKPRFQTEDSKADFIDYLDLLEIFQSEQQSSSSLKIPEEFAVEVWIWKMDRFFKTLVSKVGEDLLVVTSCNLSNSTSGLKILLTFGGRSVVCTGIITQMKKLENERLIKYFQKLKELRHPYEDFYKNESSLTLTYDENNNPLPTEK